MTAPAQNTGKAVVKEKRDQLKAKLAEFAPSYEALLPKNYPVDRLITGALVSTTANPDLLNCDPISVAASLAQIAQWGLDPGVTAFLVPFGSKCTAMIGYQGYIELICAAGARKVEAYEVREGDHFEFSYGSDAKIVHQPRSKTAPITHAYCIVTLRGGVQHFEVMSAEEIETVRQNHSKQWKRGELTYWYARKSVIRRIMKYVPKTPRLQMALNTEAMLDETGEPSPELLGRLDESKQLASGVSHRNVGLSGYEEPAAAPTPGAPVETTTVDMASKKRVSTEPGDQGYSDEDLALDQQLAAEDTP